MKKIKTKVSISVAINPKIKEYLLENIENSSKYIEYLIVKDLIDHNVIDQNEISIL